MGDTRDDFDTFQDLCDLWDQASRSDEFKKAAAPKPQTSQVPSGFLNVADDFSSEDIPEDDPYWDYHSVSTEEGLLSESKLRKLSEEKKPEPAANPIWPDTIGKDQDFPNPVWNTTDAFKTIEELKKRLYDAECKAGDKDAGGKKWHSEPVTTEDKSLWSEIESIRKQIDELSDTLGLKDDPNSKATTWSFKS